MTNLGLTFSNWKLWNVLFMIILLVAFLLFGMYHTYGNFDNNDVNNPQSYRRKSQSLDVLIAVITTQSHHTLRKVLRNTWLKSCRSHGSVSCDYKFFFDDYISVNSNTTASDNDDDFDFNSERITYNDMVLYRNSCSLTKQYKKTVNFMNSDFNETNVTVTTTSPRVYRYPQLYRFETKICVMRWILEHYITPRTPKYLVFVEDDSFLCTDNLLYQISLLNEIPSHDLIPFRTGHLHYNVQHFDDTPTFMSSVVAQAFVDNYPHHRGFSCPNHIHWDGDGNIRLDTVNFPPFLSW